MSLALRVEDMRARLGDLEILRGVDLEVPFGHVHALMGPNGSGKSTLCHALMGKPGYEVTGSALIDGVEVLGKPVDERAAAGLFETFQYPIAVPGVSLRELLTEMSAGDGEAVWDRFREDVARLDIEAFLDRPVNEGLSGGEKKRSEIFQLLASRPKVAVLDEIDSGLDIDAVREVAAAVERMRSPDLGVLIITHYSRILRYLHVDRVHIMLGGRIVRSGGSHLADELEEKGYQAIREDLGMGPATPEEAAGDPFADL